MENSNGDRKAMHETIKKSREKMETDIKDLLTKEQITKYKTYLEERRANRPPPP